MGDTLLAKPTGTGSSGDARAEWVARVLGIPLSTTGSSGIASAALPDGKPVKLAPAPILLDAKPRKMGRDGMASLRGKVRPDVRMQKPQAFDAGGGRKLEIRKGPDGRVALTAPPPPVAEITFSGGGGKGAALPGAVHALQDTLKDVSVVKGASVGSMTASLVAAGITPEDFEKAANDPNTTKRILEGRMGGKSALAHGIRGAKISGTGMQTVVREQMNKAAAKQIDAFLKKTQDELDESLERAEDSDDDISLPSSAPRVDPKLLEEVKAIRKKIEGGRAGLTFKDLRTLHQVIPDIKEVEISATMVGSDLVEEDGDKSAKKPGKADRFKSGLYKRLGIDDSHGGSGATRIKMGKPQLAMFTADTQPDMEVALAVQASAALPPVFEPVEIDLAGGFKGKFIDGGVLNNAPSSKTVQSQRSVDPIPPTGGMTFIFEEPDDADKELLAGKVTPVKNAANDHFSGAPNSAAEYARARSLADSPEDVVVVPLKFTTKGAFGRNKQKDFSTLTGGTVNFDISDKSKTKLQGMTRDATEDHIEKRKQPQTREFASDKQMLNCIGRSDLEALAAQGYPGAQGELKFRDDALAAIDLLVKAQSDDDGAKKTKQQDTLLLQLEKLAGTDADRQGFVAREMARSGRLDGLVKKGKTSGGTKLAVLDAGAAVIASVDAKAHAQTILREVIYPQMIELKPKKPRAIVLKQVDDILRAARSPEEVNRALDMAMSAFATSSKGKPKKSDFADKCQRCKMAV